VPSSKALIYKLFFMKKILFFGFLFLFFTSTTFAVDIEDNSILEQLDSSKVETLTQDIKLKTFESCSGLKNELEKYIKMYWENNKDQYKYPVMYRAMDDMTIEGKAESLTEAPTANVVADGVGGGAGNFSQTNTQVAGVDESDIVKTDGKNIYYYNVTQNAVYIIKAGTLELQKKINLPKNFWAPVLYLGENRLTIVASGYSEIDYTSKGYYINRNSKTYTIVFDTTTIVSPKLLKLYLSDGNLTESRKIGDYLYVLSNNYFNFPYWNYKNVDDISLDIGKILPQKVDVSQTSDESAQNLTIKGQEFPYSVTPGGVADCNNIEYSFPDEETLKNTSFNPGYNIISVIDIKNTSKEVKTKVIAGSSVNVHMSLNSLYLTESIWHNEPFRCPIDAMCMRPFFWGGTSNTLVHKMNVEWMSVKYQDTTLVPGAPLNQYSMDEYNGNFRIITSEWQPDRSTGLYILDKNLEKVSELTGLGKGETFQSNRFMGDKLFLVTFEQIDPLFAIDLSDIKKPTVLWELKIPGFSTYLHPYDVNHLIGLGYDTKANTWGGTQTSGLKVDLYEINYDKKCGDSDLTADETAKCASGDYKGIIVKQKYTKTLGGNGSYSEALSNPRMFVWNAGQKTLLLPATLYERDVNYLTTDFYNGLFSLKIDANSGISETGKTTHISIAGMEEKRKQDCSQYTAVSSPQPECKELLDGTLHCGSSGYTSYIPNYCFKDASIWQYIWDNSWNFQNQMVQRALYIGSDVYALSDSKVSIHEFGNLKDKKQVEMK
jgi:inhibitor of cysteine peptidase